MHNSPTTAEVVLGELDTIGPDLAHGESTWRLRHLRLMSAAGLPLDSWLIEGTEYYFAHDVELRAWCVRACGWPTLPYYLVRGAASTAEVYLTPLSGIGAVRVHPLDPESSYVARPRAGSGWDLVQR